MVVSGEELRVEGSEGSGIWRVPGTTRILLSVILPFISSLNRFLLPGLAHLQFGDPSAALHSLALCLPVKGFLVSW